MALCSSSCTCRHGISSSTSSTTTSSTSTGSTSTSSAGCTQCSRGRLHRGYTDLLPPWLHRPSSTVVAQQPFSTMVAHTHLLYRGYTHTHTHTHTPSPPWRRRRRAWLLAGRRALAPRCWGARPGWSTRRGGSTTTSRGQPRRKSRTRSWGRGRRKKRETGRAVGSNSSSSWLAGLEHEKRVGVEQDVETQQ